MQCDVNFFFITSCVYSQKRSRRQTKCVTIIIILSSSSRNKTSAKLYDQHHTTAVKKQQHSRTHRQTDQQSQTPPIDYQYHHWQYHHWLIILLCRKQENMPLIHSTTTQRLPTRTKQKIIFSLLWQHAHQHHILYVDCCFSFPRAGTLQPCELHTVLKIERCARPNRL